MALPDFAKIEHGNQIKWDDGGSPALTLAGLSTNAGQMGESVDLGAQWDEELAIWMICQFDVAPLPGGVVACYMASSWDDATWPGQVTGSDAPFPAVVPDNRAQLGNAAVNLVTIGSSTLQQVQQPVIWRPPSRYVAPVVINDADQDLAATGSLSYVLAIPRRLLVQDAA